MQYDSHGRVVRQAYTAGPGNVAPLSGVSLSYDGFDNLVHVVESRASGNLTQDFAFDDAQHLVGVTRTGSESLSFDVRADGQRAAVTVGSQSLQYGYDSLNRVNAVTGPWGSSSVSWVKGGTRLESVTDSALAQTWTYDSRGRLSSTLDLSYSYDNRDNPVSEARFGFVTRSFSHDSADRLSAVTEADGTTHRYGLYPDGLRHTEGLADGGVLTSSYDSQGALSSVVDSAGSHTQDFVVDEEGRVVSATIDGDAQATAR